MFKYLILLLFLFIVSVTGMSTTLHRQSVQEDNESKENLFTSDVKSSSFPAATIYDDVRAANSRAPPPKIKDKIKDKVNQG